MKMNFKAGKAVFLLITALLPLALGSCVVNPVTGREEFSLLSPADEVSLGARLYPAYTQAGNGLFQDADLQRYVAQVGRRLAAAGHRPDLPYEFNVVNLSVPNAWSLPGGKISVTRGILTLLENEDQLAALLGHEIGHVTARHAAQAMTRQSLAGILIGLGSAAMGQGQTQEIYEDVAGVASKLVLTKYSREQELEADRLGMLYEAGAGYSPAGMVDLMEILLSLEKRQAGLLESYFSSHPLPSERLTAARTEAGRIPGAPPADPAGKERFAARTSYLRSVRHAYGEADEGVRLLSRRRYREAREKFEEAVNIAPREALLHAYLALCELARDDIGAARRSAERAVDLYPELFLSNFVAAQVFFKMRDYRSSLEHARTANRLVADQQPVLFLMGRSHEEMGDRENAAGAFYRLLQTAQGAETRETAYARKRLRQWGYRV